MVKRVGVWGNLKAKSGGMGKDFRTNNGLESYNRRVNQIFRSGRPTLIAFVQEMEKESRYQAQLLNDIRQGKVKEPTRNYVQTIPAIPAEYDSFV